MRWKYLSFMALVALFLCCSVKADQPLPAQALLEVADQAGGAIAAVVGGDPVYLAQGSRILVLVPNADGGLEEVYATEPISGGIGGLVEFDGHLIAAVYSGSSGLLIWYSLEDSLRPVRVRDFVYSREPGTHPLDLVKYGSILYLADRHLGLVPIDLSDPGSPEVLDPVDIGLLDGGLSTASGNLLLVWTRTPIDSGVVKVYDIGQPHNPVRLGTHAVHGLVGQFDVVPGNGYFVVIAGGIEVVDMSHPAAPVTLARRNDAGAGAGMLIGDYLLTGSAGALRTWDLTRPSKPTFVTSVPGAFDGTRQIASGATGLELYFFTASGQLLDVDATDVASPRLKAEQELTFGSQVLKVTSQDAGVVIIDQDWKVVALNTGLSVTARLKPPVPHRRFHAVVSDSESAVALILTENGIFTADFSDPGEVRLLGFQGTEEDSLTTGALHRGQAWAITTTKGQLLELDVTDPEVPAITRVVETGFPVAVDLDYHDGHLYVTYRDEGLRIFRLDDEELPELVGSYAACLRHWAFDLSGSIGGLVCDDGWHFIDVSAPHAPVLLSTVAKQKNVSPRSVLVDGSQAWAGFNFGVFLLDLHDPESPFPVARYDIGGWARGMALAADQGVWVAADAGGVARLEVPDPITLGQTAAWFDPERAGEGWVVEVLDDDQVLGYWYTYDNEGNPRWLIGTGTRRGNRVVLEMQEAAGARFGAGFDPDEVVLSDAGIVRMMFSGCDVGWFQYEFDDDSLSIGLERLTRTLGLGECALDQQQQSQAPANHSGSWYDPAFAGQGFTVHRLDNDRTLVYWFTFDSQGNPYWIFGVGEDDGERIVFDEMTAARGARFGEAFDPADVELFHWGELDMKLDCLTGMAEYRSEIVQFGSGSFELERLTIPAGLSCD